MAGISTWSTSDILAVFYIHRQTHVFVNVLKYDTTEFVLFFVLSFHVLLRFALTPSMAGQGLIWLHVVILNMCCLLLLFAFQMLSRCTFLELVNMMYLCLLLSD